MSEVNNILDDEDEMECGDGGEDGISPERPELSIRQSRGPEYNPDGGTQI